MAVVLVVLVGCTLSGCTRWGGVEPGEYVVVCGYGGRQEVPMRTIQELEIDRDERAAVFTLVDGSKITTSFVPRDRSEWPSGCPTNVGTTYMEVLDIEAETLTVEPFTFNNPVLIRSCSLDPMRVTLQSGEPFPLRSCNQPGDCIHFGPKRDRRWVANDSTVSTDEDTPITIDIIASDFEVGGFLDPGTFAVTSGPANGMVVNNLEVTGTITSDTGSNSTGSPTYRIIDLVTYTPNTRFSGTDSFTYRICDRDRYWDTATVTITVKPGQ